MITLFISNKCPDCPIALESFNNINLKYRLIDITDNMTNLKYFLYYRDNYDFFDEIKQNHKVGIPLIMINEGDKFIPFDINFDLKSIKKYE